MSLGNVRHIVLVSLHSFSPHFPTPSSSQLTKFQILSGKGGVGKSSITTQLALSLSLAGHSVGILDIDLTGPSIPRLLGLEDAKITQAPGGWLPCEVHPSQTLPPIPAQLQTQNGDAVPPPLTEKADTNGTTEPRPPLLAAVEENAARSSQDDDGDEKPIGSLHAISLALLLPSRSSAVVWRGPKKTAMVRQFLTDVLWPPGTDYLLIDTPPGTSDEHISLAETLQSKASPGQLAGAVIVTTPQAVAISDVRKEVNFCKKVGVGVLGVVENMSGYVCECCGVSTNLFGKGGGEAMARSFKVPFLGGVPVDRQWGVLVEEGRRPRYGVVVGKSGEEDGEEDEGEEGRDEAEVLETDGGSGEEGGLLVDRYRDCSLCGVFEGITKQLVDIVEKKSSDTV